MTTKTQSSAGTKKISTYLMMIVFIVLALSIVSLLLAAQAYLANDVISAGFLALIGLVALSTSVFVLYQSRRQAVEMKIEAPKVMTTLECTNKGCASKTLREFQRGDYVFKDTDVPCPKCSSKQMITAIYKEVKEKEKTYNV
jgi:hypothetical protein